eukprot:11221607-Lingulodinium_polyedra.AAC.1
MEAVGQGQAAVRESFQKEKEDSVARAEKAEETAAPVVLRRIAGRFGPTTVFPSSGASGVGFC